ncbi:MAG: aldo/keto reductase [Rhodospirillaceae bacterium]
MEYRRLGQSGLTVSPICLGTMMFGLRTAEKDARRIMADAKARGINFIDTADQYAHGKSEEIIGRAIAKDRHDWVLATKVGTEWEKRPNRSGTGRKWVMEELDKSLKRLKTDFIDVYYFHKDDQDTPLAESAHAMADAIRQGKIRYFGVSNFRGWRIAALASYCDANSIPRPVVCQPYYNAMNRMPEDEILPACANYGLGVVPYSPLARGVLTGKYQWNKPAPKGTRVAINDKRIMDTEWRKESVEIAATIKRHAEKRGITAGQFATAWVLNNTLVSSVIAGPRTMEQWTEYTGALDYKFTKEDEALIDKLVKSGHPSTPGYTDPNYPPRGRVARSG